ncbi:DMT family transporter [Prochlorococcus marinus]|uniref:DMT family transporter n=1 Tax=Prochlorococcus marinus TaxID=1219 RepID=UPI0022B3950D|nr:DMT family transporter [Prochlorococcus marinus]
MNLQISKENQKINTHGVFTLIGSALAFSLMTVCIKQLNGRIPVAELIFFRSLFSIITTRLMMIKDDINPWGANKKLLISRGLIGTAALFCVFKAVESLSLAAATIIQYTYPVFSAILAWPFLGEKIRSKIIFAIILGWIGIQVVVHPLWTSPSSQNLTFLPIGIALGGAFLTALAYVTVRKLSKSEHPLVIVFYFPLISIPVTLPFLFQQGVIPQGDEWIWILGIGVFTQLGQLLITQGLSLLPAGHAGSINYSQVFFASLWGTIFFSEPVTLYLVIGAACILLATLISLSDLPNF